MTARPLRGRFRGHGPRHPRRCGGAVRDEVATVLAPMGLRLSEEKTRVCHIDEGFDFLGWRIQRRDQARSRRQAGGLHLPIQEGVGLGDGQGAIAHPPRRSIEHSPTCCAGSIRCCGDGVTTSVTGCPSATFSYLDHFAWWRIVGWLRKRHVGLNWGTLRRRHLPNWQIRRRAGRDVPATRGAD